MELVLLKSIAVLAGFYVMWLSIKSFFDSTEKDAERNLRDLQEALREANDENMDLRGRLDDAQARTKRTKRKVK